MPASTRSRARTSSRGGSKRPPGARPPAKRPGKRPARRARRSAASRQKGRRRLWAVVGAASVLAIGLAYGASRIDFGETIRDFTLPLRYENVIREEAKDEDIARTVAEGEISLPETDPALLAAVIYAESRFVDQTSSAGARGLMQITPDAADTIEGLSGGETFEYEDLADPELNIRYGSFLLRYLLYRYDGNLVAALAAYNAGPGNADSWGGANLEVGDIEFPETRAYVEQIFEKRRDYRDNYSNELGL